VQAFEALTSERQQKVFWIIRGWAALAAGKGEADFMTAQGYLAEQLHCTRRNAGDILRGLRQLGIIEQTAEHDPLAKTPARYRWALETTLPIPVKAGEPESDLNEAPF
jgi:hypothetical protein